LVWALATILVILFDSLIYHRQTGFGMPSDVEIYLRVDAVRHLANASEKDVKTPFESFLQTNHVLKQRGYLPFGKAQ
jgi:hypothetical protein